MEAKQSTGADRRIGNSGDDAARGPLRVASPFAVHIQQYERLAARSVIVFAMFDASLRPALVSRAGAEGQSTQQRGSNR
jgi:hypothetical protein